MEWARIRDYSGDLYTITAKDLAELQPHRAAWDQLAWNSPQQLPQMLPAWVEASFRHGLGPGHRWLCTFAYAGERLVGVLPIFVMPHPLLGRRWPLLRTCDWYTPSGDILLDPEHATEALRALLAEVARHVPIHAGLDLKAVRHSSPVWQAMRHGRSGYLALPGARFGYSRLDVTGGFDAYLAGLGNLRSNLKRYRRKLESRGKVSVEIRKGTDAQADFMPEFLALEASGWKGRNGTAILNDPRATTFYKALAENFAAQGRLEWYLIRVDGQLVAAQLALRCGSALILPKYAFNEDFAECRPGSLLTEEIFREAFARPEIREVNPVSHSEADRHWRMSQDDYVSLHLVRPAALPMMLHFPRVALRSAYQTYIGPRIPAVLREARRRFQRRGERRSRRAAASGGLGRRLELILGSLMSKVAATEYLLIC